MHKFCTQTWKNSYLKKKKEKSKKNKSILLRCTVKIELGINQRVFFSELTFLLYKSKYGSLVSWTLFFLTHYLPATLLSNKKVVLGRSKSQMQHYYHRLGWLSQVFQVRTGRGVGYWELIFEMPFAMEL